MNKYYLTLMLFGIVYSQDESNTEYSLVDIVWQDL